jgi:hypothetical protein
MGVANRISCDVVAGASSVNEGSSLSFSITTGGIPEGASLTWAISGLNPGTSSSADFSSSTSGSITVTGGAGSVTLTTSADSTTEGSETFTLRVYLGGALVGESATITINDTSTTYVPPPAPESFRFNLQRQNASGSWVAPNSSGYHVIDHEIPFHMTGQAYSTSFAFRYYRTNSGIGRVHSQTVQHPTISEVSWSPLTLGGNSITDTSVQYYPGETLTLELTVPTTSFSGIDTASGTYAWQVWTLSGDQQQFTIQINLTIEAV